MRGHVEGVHHVSLTVPDIEVARRFYIELLGAEEVVTAEWQPGNSWIDAIVGLEGSAAMTFMARLKNLYIEVFQYTAPPSEPGDPARPVNRSGYTHIGFQVDDIAAVYEKMVAAGLTFHAPPDLSVFSEDEVGNRVGYAATYGRDFFGNVFEIMEIHRNEGIPRL